MGSFHLGYFVQPKAGAFLGRVKSLLLEEQAGGRGREDPEESFSMEVLEPVRCLPGRAEAEVWSVARALLLYLFWGSACSACRAGSCTLCSYYRHLCFLSVFSMPLALQGPLVSVEVHALHIYLPESFLHSCANPTCSLPLWVDTIPVWCVFHLLTVCLCTGIVLCSTLHVVFTR